MTRREGYEVLAPAIEEGIGADGECVNVQLDKGGEGGIDCSFGTGFQDMELQPPPFAPLPALLESLARYSECLDSSATLLSEPEEPAAKVSRPAWESARLPCC